jgi:hypothetical protein
VRAALVAARLRALFPRFAAAVFAWRARALELADLRDSRRNAASVARERVFETF